MREGLLPHQPTGKAAFILFSNKASQFRRHQDWRGQDGLLQGFTSCKNTLNSLKKASWATEVNLTALPQADPEPTGIGKGVGLPLGDLPEPPCWPLGSLTHPRQLPHAEGHCARNSF